MALPKGMRGRIGTSNGAASGSGPRNRNVRDARDVIRGREQRPPNASTLGPRIFKTPRGLVTNKNTKGISTAQLKNRQQTQHKPTLSAHTHSAAGRPTSKMAVGAAIRKSAVINSNPMLQRVLCLLLPMDMGTVGANSNSSGSSSMHLNTATSHEHRHENDLHSATTPATTTTTTTTTTNDVQALHIADDVRSGTNAPSSPPADLHNVLVDNGMANIAAAFQGDVHRAPDESDDRGRDHGGHHKEDVNRNVEAMLQRHDGVVLSSGGADEHSGNSERREEFDRIRHSLERDDDDTANVGTLNEADAFYDAEADVVARSSAADEFDEKHTRAVAKEGGDDRALYEAAAAREPEESTTAKGAVAVPKKEVSFDEARNEVAVLSGGGGGVDPHLGEQHENDWPSEVDDKERMPDNDAVDDFELPKTCRVLQAPNGSTVYLIGTAHFSRESQNDVRRVIRKVRPRRVMIELCRQRLNIIMVDEKVLLDQGYQMNLAMIRDTIRKMGALQGAMFLLMLQFSAQLVNKLEMAPGGEFRAAFQEANRLHECEVFLGDRELNLTLWRTWASLGVWQRITIIWSLLTCREDITIEDVERCKEKDILEQLLGELCKDYPGLSQALITERDQFLCRSLYNVAMVPPAPLSIVAVVGIGHQSGIEKNWEHAETIDLQELSVIPEAPLSVRVTSRVLRVGMWLMVGAAVYKLMPRTVKQGLARYAEKGARAGVGHIGLMWKSLTREGSSLT